MTAFVTTFAFCAATGALMAWHLRRNATVEETAPAVSCPRCRAAVPADSARCPRCGVPQQIYEVVAAPTVISQDAPARPTGRSSTRWCAPTSAWAAEPAWQLAPSRARSRSRESSPSSTRTSVSVTARARRPVPSARSRWVRARRCSASRCRRWTRISSPTCAASTSWVSWVDAASSRTRSTRGRSPSRR